MRIIGNITKDLPQIAHLTRQFCILQCILAHALYFCLHLHNILPLRYDLGCSMFPYSLFLLIKFTAF